MKSKNRKGSALVLTLIVFAVLIILGTAILGFMVNENKMAINHQHKTQAYYTARSGAVAVEAAIMNLYKDENNDDEVKFINSLVVNEEKILETVDIEGQEAKVTLKLEEIAGDDRNFLLNIISRSKIGRSTETVVKVLKVSREIDKNKSKLEAPMVYTKEDGINKHLNKINEFEGGELVKYVPGKYELYEFNPDSFPNKKVEALPSSKTLSGDYFVESLDGVDLNGKEIDGEVNIYVKNGYKLDTKTDININSNGEPKNLNIFVYDGGANLKVEDGTIKYNLFVKKGNVSVNFHKFNYHGNIVLGDKVNLEIIVNDQSGNHAFIKGLIYGPESEINIGDKNHGALNVEGGIVGGTINYLNEVKNKNPGLIVNNPPGINYPIEFEDVVITTVEKGYFK